ncbi:MAG TPA: alcohol dehydrogenase catalytic domain-containing protein [Candidatus Baltobacteraceae bacterium]|jgi:L-iditol 2-dehydrogenase|nr:alcohol dehydrogenase catalytic domain-containing protein [Candidatus Baltobacteraceae bacterium]
MRAGFLIEPGRIELAEIAMPVPEPGGIVVRVRAALTDGTDLKAYRRGHPKMPMPTRFGHEFSGDVVARGDSVKRDDIVIGTPVMSVHSAACAACYWCVRDQEELCESLMSTMILGAYAEYLAIPARILQCRVFAKPEHVSYEAAAFLEPLSCVVHSVQMLAVRTDAFVVVIGDGGFGIAHALVLRAFGVTNVLLIGRRSERLDIANSLGIETLFARDLPIAEIHARSKGRGADAVIECTGTQAVWHAAPGLVRRGGALSLFGGLPGGTTFGIDAGRLHYDELRILSPFHLTTSSVRAAYELLANRRIDVLPLISGRVPLERLAEAFVELDAGRGVKYAILPELSGKEI